MIYCPAAVATVLNKWCSVARLLPGTLTTWYPQYITSYLILVLCIYIYDKMLLSYDVPIHMKNSRPKKGLKQFATKILA